MIALLKTFRRQLGQDNKIVKYVLYAIGEIILVVVGILIALQINEKVQYGRDRDLEKFYVREFQITLKQDTTVLNKLIKTLNRGEANARLALDVLEAQPRRIPDTLSFINNIQLAGAFFLNDLSSHTWEELNTSGNLRIMTNRELVSQLSNYYLFRQNLFMSGRLELTNDIYAGHLFTKETLTADELDDFFADLKVDKISPGTVQTILANPEATKLMKRMMASDKMFSRQIQSLVDKTSQLLESLRKEENSR
jgi:hypothetical protein